MPICLLCTREFSQLEIDQGVRVEHSSSGRILLTRFPSGLLHQFKISKEKLQPLPRGAFISPKAVEHVERVPESVEAPLVSTAVETLAIEVPVDETPQDVEVPGVESMAHSLNEHFQNPETYNTELEAEPEQPARKANSFHDVNPVEELGNVVEGIVVSYREGSASGFIRITKWGRERSGIFFRSDDIVRGAFVGFGVRVKCLVSEPLPGRAALTAREIEILELEPEESRKKSTKESGKTKIYDREVN
jgi:hypothetical protein